MMSGMSKHLSIYTLLNLKKNYCLSTVLVMAYMQLYTKIIKHQNVEVLSRHQKMKLIKKHDLDNKLIHKFMLVKNLIVFLSMGIQVRMSLAVYRLYFAF